VKGEGALNAWVLECRAGVISVVGSGCSTGAMCMSLHTWVVRQSTMQRRCAHTSRGFLGGGVRATKVFFSITRWANMGLLASSGLPGDAGVC
jgi:hypothetical protein